LFGLAAVVVGLGSLQMVEKSLAILQDMRNAGSQTLDGVDFSVFRIVLYVNAILTTIIGILSVVSGIGILLMKRWARLLWIGTLILMMTWMTYSFIMSSINRGFVITDALANVVIMLLLAALFYFFSREKTRSHFKVK
jgi:hypothetical protein